LEYIIRFVLLSSIKAMNPDIDDRYKFDYSTKKLQIQFSSATSK